MTERGMNFRWYVRVAQANVRRPETYWRYKRFLAARLRWPLLVAFFTGKQRVSSNGW